MFGFAALAAPDDVAAGPTLDAVKARGQVVCAMNGSRPGFSVVDSKGEWSGLEVDVCRAIAAAVLGDANKVQYVKSTTQTRLTVLQTGEVDVTLSNVTWTYGRDADLGLDFVTPTFYDGQGFMVPKKLGVKSVKELNGAAICVRPGSTSGGSSPTRPVRHQGHAGGDRDRRSEHGLLRGRCTSSCRPRQLRRSARRSPNEMSSRRRSSARTRWARWCARATRNGATSCSGWCSRCSRPRSGGSPRRRSTTCAATARRPR
jgi:hypothetical protein